MKKARPSMKKEKPKIGIKKSNLSDSKDIGVIKFGKSRPDKTKYILWDFEYNKKAGNELYKIGMEMLASNKEAVINHAIVEAIKNTVKLKCKK